MFDIGEIMHSTSDNLTKAFDLAVGLCENTY